jgi:hypothetical protein
LFFTVIHLTNQSPPTPLIPKEKKLAMINGVVKRPTLEAGQLYGGDVNTVA